MIFFFIQAESLAVWNKQSAISSVLRCLRANSLSMLKKKLQAILSQKGTDDTWLDCLTIRQDKTTVYVQFPHMYYADWFYIQKKDIFEEIISIYFNKKNVPQIIYEKSIQNYHHNDNQTIKIEEQSKNDVIENTITNRNLVIKQQKNISSKNHFSTFIANNKNAFPLAIAKEIAGEECTSNYIPFLLCGKSGTGKSHLLQSMAVAFHERHCHIIYTEASRSSGENPLWASNPDIFWQKYDALLLDDIQYLTENITWQKKLAACIDTCPRDGKHQIALTCLGSAHSCKSLDERLLSRLESGLVVELMEPDLEIRMRYLQSINKENLHLDHDQLLLIAQHCPQFRLLQGLVRKVIAFYSFTGSKLSHTDLENIMRTSVTETTPGCMEIIGNVSRSMHLRPEDVLGNKRSPDLVRARQLAMYICRQKLGLSYPELGKAFGGKDHSTVIHAVKKIRKLLLTDKSVKNFLAILEQND